MSLSEVDIFRDYLIAQKDVYLGQPATEQQITAFEMRYSVKVPSDIREYFLKINGFSIHGGFIALEPLSEWCLATEYGDYSAEFYKEYFGEMGTEDADQYFHFGNYDISVWDWYIKLSADPESETPVIVIHDKKTKIAENFTEFLQKYRISDPESLLGY